MSQAVEHIDFDFDEETDDTAEPFFANVKGRRMQFQNPARQDWKALAQAGDDPLALLRLCFLNDEDKRFFQEQTVSAEKLGAFVEKLMAHYGLGTPGKGSGLLI